MFLTINGKRSLDIIYTVFTPDNGHLIVEHLKSELCMSQRHANICVRVCARHGDHKMIVRLSQILSA